MKQDNNLVDYNHEYGKAKILVILICIISMALSIIIVKSGIDEAEESRQTIFIADANNTLLLALANDITLNRPNEAKAAVKRMHYFMFNLTPAAKHINSSLEKATLLSSDQTVVQHIEKLKEMGWYNRMVADGISTEFMCDSIRIEDSDRDDAVYKAKLFGKTSYIYPDRIEFKSLITSCYLQNADRTIEEPNGFLIKLWSIEKQENIKTFMRVQNSMKEESQKENSIEKEAGQ
ncbi:MAG: hypothetical protein MJZ37_05380 [Bacilli bacterium]|nr:hypothetical protein [Bacilli bacterium]